MEDSERACFSQVMKPAGEAQVQCTLVTEQTLAFLLSAIQADTAPFPPCFGF